MAEEKLDAVGCGSMVVDLFYRAPRIIQADQKILLDPHSSDGEVERRAVGGVVLNHLGWARVLGLEVGIFGKMADDRHGAFLRQGMDRFGIRHHLTLDGSTSAFSTVFVDPAGNRAIYMWRGATAELRPEEIRGRHGGFIRRAHLVSTEISQLELKTVIALLLYARTHSIATVLDIDVPPSDACAALGTRAELERALKLATILKPAKLAAREMVGKSQETLKMAAAISARYADKPVVLTDGADGCAIAAPGIAMQVPAFRTKPVDTTGAGDAFLGAMLAGLRWGLPWPSIGRLANAAGAVCISQLGAFPARLELRDKIEKLYGDALPAPAEPAVAPAVVAAAGAVRDPGAEVDSFLDLCLTELETLRSRIDAATIWQTVELIRAVEAGGGRVHVTGIGKPESVARYAASLFCSVGTIATFLDATETLHGSLGQVHKSDVVIAISNSGNTAEVCAAAIAIRNHGARLVAVTANPNSELAQMADLVLLAPVEREGGVLGLAPRISVLAETYVLAALSVALEAARGLTLEDYARWHRSGALGEAARRLAANRAARRKLNVV